MEKSYYTYVLLCADKSYYCGFTDKLEQRLASHNSGKGGKYTSRRVPVELATYVEFDNEHDARSCEWWFKHKLSRQEKIRLIQSKQIQQAYEKWTEKRGK